MSITTMTLKIELDDLAFCTNCPCAVLDRDGVDCCSALDYQELYTEHISTMSGGLYFKLRPKECPLAKEEEACARPPKESDDEL